MNNIYETPKANLQEPTNHTGSNYALYKVSGVGLATFIGTPLAGGIILSINYKRLGKFSESRKSIIFSLLGTLALLFLAVLIPDDLHVPNTVFSVVPIVVMIMLAKQLQEAEINRHISTGGAIASNWKALGIGFIVIICMLAVTVPIIIWLTKS